MDFPRLVFTSPGALSCNGGTYAAHLVNDQDEFDAAMEAGYFPTLPEALKGEKAEELLLEEDPPAEDPPAEDPPAEDPSAEDPPAEDPPAEDPSAEEPRFRVPS